MPKAHYNAGGVRNCKAAFAALECAQDTVDECRGKWEGSTGRKRESRAFFYTPHVPEGTAEIFLLVLFSFDFALSCSLEPLGSPPYWRRRSITTAFPAPSGRPGCRDSEGKRHFNPIPHRPSHGGRWVAVGEKLRNPEEDTARPSSPSEGTGPEERFLEADGGF